MTSKITCSVINDLLPLYIDKALSSDSVSLVEEHLEGCKFCRAEMEKMGSTLTVAQNSDKKRIKEMEKRVGVGRFIGISILCVAAAALILAAGVLLGNYFTDNSGDQISKLRQFWCVTVSTALALIIWIGWGLYLLYYLGRSKEDISARIKKKAVGAYSIFLIVCVVFSLTAKLVFIGSPASSENVNVRTEFQYSEDSYLQQEWVIHFTLNNGREINVISECVYETDERGERQNTGMILYVHEIPISKSRHSGGYTCGYSRGVSFGDETVSQSENFTFTVVYKDKKYIYDMRNEGLYDKQDAVKYAPATTDTPSKASSVRQANGMTDVYNE